MSEVETTEAVESPSAEPVEGEESATPAEEPVSTWKARVAGKDRALTAAKQEAERFRSLADELSAWKAEKERADLSEVDRLNLQVQELQAEKAAAVAAAERATLKMEFPLAFALLGDLTPTDPGALATLEARLKAQAEPPEPEPRVEPNNPRRPNSVYQPTSPSAPNGTPLEVLQARAKELTDGVGGLKGMPSFEARVPLSLSER